MLNAESEDNLEKHKGKRPIISLPKIITVNLPLYTLLVSKYFL